MLGGTRVKVGGWVIIIGLAVGIIFKIIEWIISLFR